MKQLQVEPNEVQLRLQIVQGRMRQRALAACVYTLPENIHYLSGFGSTGYDRFRALVVPVEGAPVLLLPVVEAASGLAHSVCYPYGLDEDPVLPLSRLLRELVPGLRGQVGMEERHFFLRIRVVKGLQEQLPAISLVDCVGLVEESRLIKSDFEQRRIRQAGFAATRGMVEAARTACTGRTENDVAAAIFGGMLAAGSGYPASPPYVTAGERTGLPHATWEGARLEPGDLLLVEHAASVARYHAAIMRTGCVGTPTPEQAHAHETVVQCLEAMVAAIRPGVLACEVDAVGRTMLRNGGWDRTHNLGYSIGLAYPPGWNEAYLFALNSKNERSLEPGMALYLIPSVHVSQRFTVGCGDTILVTDSGCETLTPFPHRLISLNSLVPSPIH